MGTIRRRGDRYYAEVCVDGVRRGKTHKTKTQARVWIEETEDLLDSGVTEVYTLGDALKRAESAKPDRASKSVM